MIDLYTIVGKRLFELVWRSSAHRPDDLETCKLAEEGAIVAVRTIASKQLSHSGVGQSIAVAGRTVFDRQTGRQDPRPVQAFKAFTQFLSAAGLARAVTTRRGPRISCRMRLSKAFCALFRDAFDSYLDQLPNAGLSRRGFQAMTAQVNYYDCVDLATELHLGVAKTGCTSELAEAQALVWATFAEVLDREGETFTLTLYHRDGDIIEYVRANGQRLKFDYCRREEFQRLMMHCYKNGVIPSVTCCSLYTMVGIDGSFVRKVRRSLGLRRLFDMHADRAAA